MTMPKLNTFAARLKHARREAKLTQKQLADRIGVSQAIISQLETGQYDKTVYTAQLAHACNVPAQWLATGENVHERTNLNKIVVEKIDSIEQNQPLMIKEWSEVVEGLGNLMRYQYKYIGDSMTGQSGPHIPSGAVLTIDATITPAEGNVVLVNHNGHPGIGVYSNIFGVPHIRPSNPQYQAHPIDTASIVGVVCSYTVNF